jgi:hypothetical protein
MRLYVCAVGMTNSSKVICSSFDGAHIRVAAAEEGAEGEDVDCEDVNIVEGDIAPVQCELAVEPALDNPVALTWRVDRDSVFDPVPGAGAGRIAGRRGVPHSQARQRLAIEQRRGSPTGHRSSGESIFRQLLPSACDSARAFLPTPWAEELAQLTDEPMQDEILASACSGTSHANHACCVHLATHLSVRARAPPPLINSFQALLRSG